ncbi:hypothetical protein ASA1KI_31370 [Opitutales bacterium ASA1]|uniref:hypothetical protein n=1 Tax=Congregicoccus parvus TaxID=3081749 RepID=UPI002B2F43F7|nr:hypothetical protein ASA1KI_31370 [Opitutales bacterium ASA1]
MKAAKSWITKPASPKRIHLDPFNPRLAPTPHVRSERELVEALVTTEDVFDVAKSISLYGFFPTEAVVVVEEEIGTVVIEGNRRVAACKLLLAPTLAPKGWEKKFRGLVGPGVVEAIRSIPTVVAPTREEAYPMIVARHTAPQISSWAPAMRATFYWNLQKRGYDFDAMARLGRSTPSEVRKALQDHEIYSLACQLEIPEAGTVRNAKKFDLTTLARFVRTPAGKAFLGVTLGQDGTVRGHIHVDEFRKGFGWIVSEIANGRATSRTFNKNEDVEKYVREDVPREFRPNVEAKGSFSSSNTRDESDPEPTDGNGSDEKKSRRKALGPNVGLIPRDVKCALKHPRVAALLVELQKLSPKQFTNACAFTFRSFLEISLYCFLDERGQLPAMKAAEIARIDAKNQSRPDGRKERLPEPWMPGLKEMLTWVSKPENRLLKDHTMKALPKIVSEQGALFGLNLSTHNPAYHPSEAVLRDTWLSFSNLLTEILE